MSKFKKKFIDNDAIDQTKVKFDNDAFFRARNAANSADINVFKLNATDEAEFNIIVKGPAGAPTQDNQFANKKYVDDEILALGGAIEWKDSVLDIVLDTASITPTGGERYLIAGVGATGFLGHDNEIAQYNSGDKDLAASYTFTVPTTGTAINVDDETDGIYLFTGGAWSKKAFEATVGGAATTLNGNAIDVNVDGSTIEISGNNLQVKDSGITEAKLNNVDGDIDAQSFVLPTGYTSGAGAIAAGDTVDSAIRKLDGNISALTFTTPNKEVFTLNATDISNGYVDLANLALASSFMIQPDGGPLQEEGVDYIVNLTGGAGGKTRITFAGDLTTGPSALVNGDKITIKYDYKA